MENVYPNIDSSQSTLWGLTDLTQGVTELGDSFLSYW
jgi:hypothetical protein